MQKLSILRNDLKSKLKVNTNNEVINIPRPSSPKKISLEDLGFNKARNLAGSKTGLLSCLALLKEEHKQIARNDVNEQEKLKKPFLENLESSEVKIVHNKAEIEYIKSEVIPKKENLIVELKNEIDDAIVNPRKVGGDKSSKVGFIIGSLILIAVTLYLFVFYSSASYAAFFKSFGLNDLGVASSIFDAQAITKAYHDGFTELILIISMPFVFIGIGFLIHQFNKEEGIGKYFKLLLLMVITFAFDAILAYEITEKIYNIKAGNSFQEMQSYNLDFAFHSVNFWLIIFAGFVVYLVWGAVFDFVMDTHDKLDVLKHEIKAREDKILLIKDEILNKNHEIETLKKEIKTLEVKIVELKNQINFGLINVVNLEKQLQEFLQGWLHWMNANKLHSEKIDEATNIVNEFVAQNSTTVRMN